MKRYRGVFLLGFFLAYGFAGTTLAQPIGQSDDPFAWREPEKVCDRAQSSSVGGRPVASIDCGVKFEIVPLAVENDLLVLGLRIANDTSDYWYGFRPGDVQITQRGSALYALTIDELEQILTQRSNGRTLMTGLASVIDAIGTGMNGGRRRISGSYSGRTSSGERYSGDYEGTVSDPEAKARARQDSRERRLAMQQESSDQNESGSRLLKNYWKDMEVGPGEEGTMTFVVRLNTQTDHLKFGIPVGGMIAELRL